MPQDHRPQPFHLRQVMRAVRIPEVIMIAIGSLIGLLGAKSYAPARSQISSCQCLAVADPEGLPLVEMPAQRPNGTLAVMVSGDGGWRAIDRKLAEGLNARGVSVVGLVSSKYFSDRRTPDEASCALRRILQYYMRNWRTPSVILVGYSRGAGVLPFMVNRLPSRLRSHIRTVALLGLEKTIDFQVTAADLFRSEPLPAEIPVIGEVEKLRQRVVCFYGLQEKDSLCRELSLPLAVTIAEPGGHHFAGSYDQLAGTIWKWSEQ